MAASAPFNATAKPPTELTQPRSQWGHSPVPYLFGGLAAMLGLIAFALLVLACSYWKLSGSLEMGEGEQGERDLEAGEGKGDDAQKKAQPQVLEQKFLVIMAGEMKPTFLATPASSRSYSFGEKSETSCCGEKSEKLKEKEKQDEAADQDH
ncbi:hypothetical protein SLEP1_g13190 [Rubroshorea leprosula]|uniref:Protein GLUTAMINE DUMPER 3 n=1 Tax=Rubroshorea leprosula TaxID=152421 RepID=A0AAV5IPP9_9ROSI|nr:hypothetical protein SLEP1_g13190 [Rubroshorea leprosula]